MKLVTVNDLADYIGFDAGVASNKLDSAVEAATQALIGCLLTEFDRVAVVDDFYILSTGSLPIGSTYRTRLALSRGFIVGDVTMIFSHRLEDLTTDFSPVDPGWVKVDAEKAGVVITGPDLRDCFVRVSYTAGFEADDSDPTLYDQGQLPEWLKESALMLSVAYLDSSHPDLRFEKGSGAKDSANAMRAAVNHRIAGKVRYFPSATNPIG